MPRHVYVCTTCSHRFERTAPYGTPGVGRTACTKCLNVALKSYEKQDLMAASIPDIEPYYEEQLGKWVSGRKSLKDAMHAMSKDTDGKVKPEWY